MESDIDEIIIGKYILSNNLLGEGSFGKVYSGLYKNKSIAIKVEDIVIKQPQLFNEYNIMKMFNDYNVTPKILDYVERNNKRYLIMERLNINIDKHFELYFYQFKLKTILTFAIKGLNILEIIHNKDVIHRDIKPENFLTGNDSSNLYLIDFGLAKINNNENEIISQSAQAHKPVGSKIFCSLDNHLGKELNRKDDLESFCYILAYLCNGKLPWMGIQAKTMKEKIKKIALMKKNIKIDELFTMIPKEFKEFMEIVKRLKKEEVPKYKEYIGMFEKCFQRFDYKKLVFEWEKGE